MNVLVINCGSSSLKFQLINAESEEVLAKGLCERIGIDGRLSVPAGRRRKRKIGQADAHTYRGDPVCHRGADKSGDRRCERSARDRRSRDTAWYTEERNSLPQSSSQMK